MVFIGCVKEGKEVLLELLEQPCEVAAIFTFDDEMAGKTSGSVNFDDVAGRHAIPLYRVRSTNTPEIVHQIRELAPDVIFVIGWTRLVSDEILAIPPLGCVGMHASLLPRYRGRAPVNWAIINNESETGNSAILLDAGVDTGKVLAQRRFPITLADSCKTVYDKVAESGRDMVRELVPHLLRGQLPCVEQDESQATVMPKRTPEDGIIDWGKPALELFNWIRALTRPYPGAFSYYDGKRLFIWEARIVHDTDWQRDRAIRKAPGTVISTEDGIIVAAGFNERLALHRLSFDTGPELRWHEFLQQSGLRAGDVLGKSL